MKSDWRQWGVLTAIGLLLSPMSLADAGAAPNIMGQTMRHANKRPFIRTAPAARLGRPGVSAALRASSSAKPRMLVGIPAASRFERLAPANVRRLAIMARDGTLDGLPHSQQLLDVIARYGDSAMEFVWRHKGALASTGVMIAFLRDPEPYLTGARDLLALAADAVAQPVSAAAGNLATVAAQRIPWEWMWIAVAAAIIWRHWRRQRTGH